MGQKIVHVSLLVRDYDEAIDYYTRMLNFVLLEDTRLSETKRWVRVAPTADAGFSLLLAQASGDLQLSRVGCQNGGRVFLFIHTDNLDRDYHAMKDKQVTFVREPSIEAWGKVAVFADLYGNLWELIEPAPGKR